MLYKIFMTVFLIGSSCCLFAGNGVSYLNRYESSCYAPDYSIDCITLFDACKRITGFVTQFGNDTVFFDTSRNIVGFGIKTGRRVTYYDGG